MMSKLGRILLGSVFIMVGFIVSAASFQPPIHLQDPHSSEAMLADREFIGPLEPNEQAVADRLRISLTTMGRGDPLYVWFGHSGLVVTDSQNGRSVMYDYGIFSFDDDFYRTFALGRLNYEVWATSEPARNDLAIEEDRTITKISLDLPASSKLELVNFLNYNVQPEHNTYLYHHYRENCSTRIRDLIDKAVGGEFKTWATSIEYDETLRQMVMRHTAVSPFVDWVLNFLQSGSIDKPITLWEAMFLPEVLEQALLEFHYADGRPIVNDSETIHTATEGIRPPVLDTWRSMTIPGMLFGLSLGLLSLFFGRVMTESKFATIRRTGLLFHGLINFLWTFATGLLSILLVFMMFASNHDVTYFNENILFVTPWLMVMAFQALRSAFGHEKSLSRFRKANTVMLLLVGIVVVLKGVLFDVMIQRNWQIIFTMLPLYVCNSTIPFERLFRRKSRFPLDNN